MPYTPLRAGRHFRTFPSDARLDINCKPQNKSERWINHFLLIVNLSRPRNFNANDIKIQSRELLFYRPRNVFICNVHFSPFSAQFSQSVIKMFMTSNEAFYFMLLLWLTVKATGLHRHFYACSHHICQIFLFTFFSENNIQQICHQALLNMKTRHSPTCPLYRPIFRKTETKTGEVVFFYGKFVVWVQQRQNIIPTTFPYSSFDTVKTNKPENNKTLKKSIQSSQQIRWNEFLKISTYGKDNDGFLTSGWRVWNLNFKFPRKTESLIDFMLYHSCVCLKFPDFMRA